MLLLRMLPLLEETSLILLLLDDLLCYNMPHSGHCLPSSASSSFNILISFRT